MRQEANRSQTISTFDKGYIFDEVAIPKPTRYQCGQWDMKISLFMLPGMYRWYKVFILTWNFNSVQYKNKPSTGSA